MVYVFTSQLSLVGALCFRFLLPRLSNRFKFALFLSTLGLNALHLLTVRDLGLLALLAEVGFATSVLWALARHFRTMATREGFAARIRQTFFCAFRALDAHWYVRLVRTEFQLLAFSFQGFRRAEPGYTSYLKTSWIPIVTGFGFICVCETFAAPRHRRNESSPRTARV